MCGNHECPTIINGMLSTLYYFKVLFASDYKAEGVSIPNITENKANAISAELFE